MEDLPVTIRKMELGDVDGGLRLSTEQGWNQTESDWRLLVGEEQNCCLLAEWEGKVVGTTTAMIYSKEVAWIGMVLVDRAYRGRGISKLLLAAIFKQLSFCKSIKLDATPEGRLVYQHFGFADEYKIARMTIDPLPFELSPTEEGSSTDRILSVELAAAGSAKKIIALDRMVFGAERKSLVEALMLENPGNSWILQDGTGLIGFALGRKGSSYQQIGPVVAPGFADAKMLVAKALFKLRGKPVVVDIPYDKQALIEWLRSIGFVQQRHFTRMYKGGNPFPGETGEQYLICGPEFG